MKTQSSELALRAAQEILYAARVGRILGEKEIAELILAEFSSLEPQILCCQQQAAVLVGQRNKAEAERDDALRDTELVNWLDDFLGYEEMLQLFGREHGIAFDQGPRALRSAAASYRSANEPQTPPQ